VDEFGIRTVCHCGFCEGLAVQLDFIISSA
jgi:hypothetical protein